jgi:hypothetical protein
MLQLQNISTLRQQLQDRANLTRKVYPHHHDWKYGSFEELVLDCGSEFTTFSSENLELNFSEGCYQNCQQLIKKHPELTYCEGYVLAPDVSIPIKHGWLINDRKEVIEPTWDIDNSIYLGISFSIGWFTYFLNERFSKGKEDEISIFEGNYLEKYSLLKEGLPPEAYLI